MDKYIGKILDGRYEILEIIGVGGMAVVYKAMDHRLNRLVAVKILKDDYSNDADLRRRFHGESQAVAMMSHPNIVSVYDVSKNEGLDYIVMELIDGISLKQYMEKKGPLSWRETLHFAMQIAKALEHAHGRSIIHRDIKPHNVMILKDGSVKVADFGIARIASAQNTLTKEALGSVHYISPEQARGARVDNRSDIYSLGVVMYEMLTGRPPYDGETPVSVAIQHINGTPLSPSLLNSEIPTGLEQITMHAMCSDLNIRYASVTDMLKDMEEFRKNPAIRFTFLPAGAGTGARTQPTRPQNNGQRPAARVNRQEELEREYERQDREERRRRLLMIGALALAVVALIGILILILSNKSEQNAETETNTTEVSTTVPEYLFVPQMIGYIWDEIQESDYPGIRFVVNESSYIYNEDYPIGVICDQAINVGEKVKYGTEVFLYISLGEKTDTMPDLTRSTLENAKNILNAMQVDVTILTDKEYSDDIPEDRVTRTDPEAGATLKNNQFVTIYISMGKETKTVLVPNVVGKDASIAEATLTAKNLKVNKKEEFSNTVPSGTVISQTPSENAEVEEGSTVTIVVSKGKQTVTMINVVGDTKESAENRLNALGLMVFFTEKHSDTVAAGKVMEQSQAAGIELMPNTAITLTISIGPEQSNPDPEPSQSSEPSPTEPTPQPTDPTESSDNNG